MSQQHLPPESPVLTPLLKPSAKQRKAAKIFTETKETLMISILAARSRSAESPPGHGLPLSWREPKKRDPYPKRERLIKKIRVLIEKISLMVWYLPPMYSMLKGSKSFCCSILATTSQKVFKTLIQPNLSNGLLHAIHVDGGIIFMLPNWDLSSQNCVMVGAKGTAALDIFSFKQTSRYIYCIYFFWGRWQVSR